MPGAQETGALREIRVPAEILATARADDSQLVRRWEAPAAESSGRVELLEDRPVRLERGGRSCREIDLAACEALP